MKSLPGLKWRMGFSNLQYLLEICIDHFSLNLHTSHCKRAIHNIIFRLRLIGFPVVPPPLPDANFSGMTEEELKAMEGQERQNLEARLQCLRNIHTLLDAAMVQIQQYTAVVQSLG